MKVALTVGTRPEIVKMAPVIRAFRERRVDTLLVHTGQHYDDRLDGVFFRDLELDVPDVRLKVGSGSRDEMIAKIRTRLVEALAPVGADLLLVQGDTNSVLGAALAANDLGIAVGHVEAGLRCGDMRMAEEHNRIETDRISQRLFAPTEGARSNLRAEGIDDAKIHVTGNTVVDELMRQRERSNDALLPRLGVRSGEFLLATVHRRENVEDDDTLRAVARGIHRAADALGRELLLTLHPRTAERMEELGIPFSDRVRRLPPLGYLDFVALQRHAQLIITDSGGVQEEACVLRVPVVVLRESTERPESVEVGGAELVGQDEQAIVAAAQRAAKSARDWPNPFGDGTAGEQIASACVDSRG